MRHFLLTSAILFASTIGALALEDSTSVKTIKGITDKMLELISFEIDEVKDWDEYRTLFLPTSQKVFINRNAPKGRQVNTMNLEEFVRNVGPLYPRDGFEEYAIGLTIKMG